jgi:hypothetical protein
MSEFLMDNEPTIRLGLGYQQAAVRLVRSTCASSRAIATALSLAAVGDFQVLPWSLRNIRRVGNLEEANPKAGRSCDHEAIDTSASLFATKNL